MRATMSGYYRNLNYDQNKVVKELFDVTKQISSGTKIQYAYEDISTFVDTVRLDNEITTLTQVKQNAQRALQFSTNTDSTMNEMTKILDAMKVKLVAAANETNSTESLNAIALELRGLEKNLIALANTSIDGKYIFSGSEVKTKTIDDNGIYQGNDADLQSFIGSGVQQTYNINGADLFLGDENDTRRKITLNIVQFNQTKLHPDVMNSVSGVLPQTEYITVSDSIRDLMGDNDSNIDTLGAKHNFYIRGTDTNGVPFKEVVSLKDTDSVNDLMVKIGESFGNTTSQSVVEVSINKHGQIEIQDRFKGSSKLDFNLSASTAISYNPEVLADNNNPALAADEFEMPGDAALLPATILSVNDTILVSGEIYTVLAVASAGVPQVDTIQLDRNITNNLSSAEVFKSTGSNVNNDIANNIEFNQFGIPIKDFMNSNHTQYTELMNLEQDIFNSNKFTLAGDFITKEGDIADTFTRLVDVFKSDVASIEFTGRDSDGTALVSPNFINITATTTIDDLVKQIDAIYDPANRDVLSISFSDGKIQIGKKDTFEFATTQSAFIGQNTITLGSTNQNYTPLVGDTISFEGDPKPYTIGAVAGSTVTLTQNLIQSVSLNTKVTLTTARADEFDIQLEAYSLLGGSATAGTLRVNGLPSDSSLVYDEARFSQDNNKLFSDVSQISRVDNSYAVDSTKLIDVAGVNSFQSLTPAIAAPNILNINGIDVNGNYFDASLTLQNDLTAVPPGVFFTVTSGNPAVSTDYQVYNVNFNDLNGDRVSDPGEGIVTTADNMTYKQLTDVINMITTNTLPAQLPGTLDAADFHNTVKASNSIAATSLDSKGKIIFEQLNTSSTKASLSIADANASDFSSAASILTFQTNNTLEVSDTKTDFFSQIDAMISSVESGRTRANGDLDDPRNLGVQNAIQGIDDLSAHLFNQHSKIGVHSQTLQTTEDRTDLLIITTQTLRSQTLDIDIAEASLNLQQLTLNYQAMLSTVSRVTQLSLVNYL